MSMKITPPLTIESYHDINYDDVNTNFDDHFYLSSNSLLLIFHLLFTTTIIMMIPQTQILSTPQRLTKMSTLIFFFQHQPVFFHTLLCLIKYQSQFLLKRQL